MAANLYISWNPGTSPKRTHVTTANGPTLSKKFDVKITSPTHLSKLRHSLPIA